MFRVVPSSLLLYIGELGNYSYNKVLENKHSIPEQIVFIKPKRGDTGGILGSLVLEVGNIVHLGLSMVRE